MAKNFFCKLFGVLNVTPDSFSDGGRYLDAAKALEHCLRLREDGADLIDIGAESSRPGAKPVSAEEQISRLDPLFSAFAGSFDFPLSIDTMSAEVADFACERGAVFVNDVSALRGDENMAEVICRRNVSVILMHMRGNPQSMQENPNYDDVTAEVADFLEERANFAISKGIRREKIWLDPGFGFGKTLEQNYELLKGLGRITALGFPVLAGFSRKSMIGSLLDRPLNQRLPGSLGALALALASGISGARVHDVRETRDFLRVYEKGHSPAERKNSPETCHADIC